MRRSALVLLSLVLTACAAAPTVQTSAPVADPRVSRSPNALTPVATSPRPITAPSIRVGLLSDQARVSFPRIPDGYYLVSESGPARLQRGFTATAPLAEATVRYAVQVSTLSDETSARQLVEKLRADTGLRADMVFNPATGTHRILAGDFESSEAANPTRARLIEQGYGRDLLVVRRPSDEQFEHQIEIVDDEGDRYTLRGRTIGVAPFSAETITLDNKPYRSAAQLFINARGLLNVVNQLNLEEYLYGVVPAEMGPSIYDEVEALKAQAVAARTYAVRNMGQFSAEGYDICPGPACQAYNGFGGEHALSTRAVRETAGLILTYEGKPIDALYTSTCGGETSDVGTMFPGRTDPYLKRARCVEHEMVSIAGRSDSTLLTEQQVNARLFAALSGLPEAPANWSAREVTQAVAAAVQLGGATAVPRETAASSRRGDVLDYLARVLQLDRNARVLTLPEDRRYFFPMTQNPDAAPYLAASFLIKYGVDPAQYIDRVALTQPIPRDELYALLLGWLRERNAVTVGEGKIFTVSGRGIQLKQRGEVTSFTLPAGVPIFRRLSDRYQEYSSVPVMIGDRATMFLSTAKRPVAMIVHANYDGASFDRTSNFANWTRSYRADELVSAINRRQPIRQLVDIRPVKVDASHRVAELEVTAEGGRTFVLRGLPVRWSLNLPDNLFVYDKTRDPDGVDRYTFFGKGWGHGTGMCQVGSYGMAFRGWTFDRILRHFYTGVTVSPMAPAS
jgi:stage II sporulation protein D